MRLNDWHEGGEGGAGREKNDRPQAQVRLPSGAPSLGVPAYWALALLAGNVAVIIQDGNGRGGG